jgi:hypothetical protein
MSKKIAILIAVVSLFWLQFTNIEVHENIEEKNLFKIIKSISFGIAKFVSISLSHP